MMLYYRDKLGCSNWSFSLNKLLSKQIRKNSIIFVTNYTSISSDVNFHYSFSCQLCQRCWFHLLIHAETATHIISCIFLLSTQRIRLDHYIDVIMSAMTSQITGIKIVYSTICLGANQRKHQSSASLASVREIYRWPVNSRHKGQVTRKIW